MIVVIISTILLGPNLFGLPFTRNTPDFVRNEDYLNSAEALEHGYTYVGEPTNKTKI